MSKLDVENQKLMKMIVDMALRTYTKDQLRTCTIDGLSELTGSARIMYLCRLAYFKGMIRGVLMSQEIHDKIGYSEELVCDGQEEKET